MQADPGPGQVFQQWREFHSGSESGAQQTLGAIGQFQEAGPGGKEFAGSSRTRTTDFQSVAGFVQELGRLALQNHSSVIDQTHPVADLLYLAQVMAGKEHRDPFLARQAKEEFQHVLHPLGVQTRERFVQDQEFGGAEQCARDRRPTALPMGQTIAAVVGAVLQTHQAQDFFHASPAADSPADPGQLQVLADAQPVIESGGIERHPDRDRQSLKSVGRHAEDLTTTARLRQETEDRPEGGALARTVAPEQAVEIAGMDLQVHSLQDSKPPEGEFEVSSEEGGRRRQGRGRKGVHQDRIRTPMGKRSLRLLGLFGVGILCAPAAGAQAQQEGNPWPAFLPARAAGTERSLLGKLPCAMDSQSLMGGRWLRIRDASYRDGVAGPVFLTGSTTFLRASGKGAVRGWRFDARGSAVRCRGFLSEERLVLDLVDEAEHPRGRIEWRQNQGGVERRTWLPDPSGEEGLGPPLLGIFDQPFHGPLPGSDAAAIVKVRGNPYARYLGVFQSSPDGGGGTTTDRIETQAVLGGTWFATHSESRTPQGSLVYQGFGMLRCQEDGRYLLHWFDDRGAEMQFLGRVHQDGARALRFDDQGVIVERQSEVWIPDHGYRLRVELRSGPKDAFRTVIETRYEKTGE